VTTLRPRRLPAFTGGPLRPRRSWSASGRGSGFLVTRFKPTPIVVHAPATPDYAMGYAYGGSSLGQSRRSPQRMTPVT